MLSPQTHAYLPFARDVLGLIFVDNMKTIADELTKHVRGSAGCVAGGNFEKVNRGRVSVCSGHICSS